METGLGGIEWPPAVFWDSTMRELLAAVDGMNRKNGGGSSLERGDVKRLRRMLDEAK